MEILSDTRYSAKGTNVKTRKNYQIPVTQQKGNGDMQAAKRDRNAPHTRDLNIWLCGR